MCLHVVLVDYLEPVICEMVILSMSNAQEVVEVFQLCRLGVVNYELRHPGTYHEWTNTRFRSPCCVFEFTPVHFDIVLIRAL